MSNLSTFFPTVTATSLGLGNSANVTFGSVTTGAVTASGPLSGAGFTDLLAAPPAIGSTTRNTGAFTTLSANNGTLTASAPVLDLEQTWNNAAVAFTGVRFNAVRTAASDSSALLSLTVAGNNRFSVIDPSTGSTRLSFSSSGFAWDIRTRTGGGVGCNFSGIVGVSSRLEFLTTSTSTVAGDVHLVRESADTLAMVRSTNGQTFRLYNTQTDANNYERGFMRWSSNVLQIGTEAGGTGSARDLQFQTSGTTRLTLATNGNSTFSGWVFLTNSARLNINGGEIALQTSGGADTAVISRDTTGVVALRSGTTAHSFRIYNTVSGTNNVNFDRVNFRWASNEFIIDAEAGGTGTLRGIKIGSATSSLLGFYGATPVDRPATVADPAGGGTIDAEARTAINDIIDRLQELGLIA